MFAAETARPNGTERQRLKRPRGGAALQGRRMGGPRRQRTLRTVSDREEPPSESQPQSSGKLDQGPCALPPFGWPERPARLALSGSEEPANESAPQASKTPERLPSRTLCQLLRRLADCSGELSRQPLKRCSESPDGL